MPNEEFRGRPVDITQEEAFLKVAAYLQDNDDEQITVSDLVLKTKEHCGYAYSVKYMKKKIKEHFGNELLITNVNGKADVATFNHCIRNTA